MFHPYVKIKKKNVLFKCGCRRRSICVLDSADSNSSTCTADIPDVNSKTNGGYVKYVFWNNACNDGLLDSSHYKPIMCLVLLVRCHHLKDLRTTIFCDKR